MLVAKLMLTGFRSYRDATAEFTAGVNVLLGPNGVGKTNLLEAVGYLATLGSHRVATDAPLVHPAADRAVIRAEVVRDQRRLLVELEINPGKANRARLGGSPVPRPREVLGALRTVLFAPTDLQLVQGDPADRRRYLDDLLVARAPRLAGVRADYDRVLKQRNALLKSAAAATRRPAGPLPTLDVWDTHLARTGAVLTAARVDLLEHLRPLVDKNYAAVAAGTAGVGMQYRPAGVDPGEWEAVAALGPDALSAALLEAVTAHRAAELERGTSLVGPHRDELVLSLGTLPARGYASHGESWSLALALRLAGYDLLRADGGEPVLLLDDVFAELDSGRRDRLADLVAPAEQVLLTAAVDDDVPAALGGSRFSVTPGGVTHAG